MADESAAGGTANQQTPASFNLIGQYIRDLSFENPGAPGSVMLGGGNPQFNVGINVGVKKQAEDVYAVEITLNAKAEREKNVLFNVELIYGGETLLKAGDCAAFKKNSGNGHHMINRSATTALYLEIGSRSPTDMITSSDVDMMSSSTDGLFRHKDGTPYEE